MALVDTLLDNPGLELTVEPTEPAEVATKAMDALTAAALVPNGGLLNMFDQIQYGAGTAIPVLGTARRTRPRPTKRPDAPEEPEEPKEAKQRKVVP